MQENKTPRVFISYNWGTETHLSWVMQLAERLVANGIDVLIDKWELKPGDDKFVFMERMVQDESIDYVLMLLDKEYKEKADSRRGGVGTEAQILSAELYQKITQSKFIPIVTEYDEKHEPYVPVFVKNRIYIDLSTGTNFEDQYQQLVRFVYNKPLHKKPNLGTPPEYLLEERQNLAPLISKVYAIEQALVECKPVVASMLTEYFDLFQNLLEEHRMAYAENLAQDYGRLVFESIEKMIPIRDSYP
jgi:hypothetical protein